MHSEALDKQSEEAERKARRARGRSRLQGERKVLSNARREQRTEGTARGERMPKANSACPPSIPACGLLDGCERTGNRQFARSPSAQASGTGHTSLGRCQKQPEQLRVNVGEHSKRARERAHPHPRTCPGTRVRVWPDRQNLASALDTEVQVGDCAAAAPSSVSLRNDAV